MMAPRLELMGRQDAPHRFARDVRDHTGCDHLPGEFRTVPLAERASLLIRSLAGHLDHMQGHDRGERRRAPGTRLVVEPADPLRQESPHPHPDIPLADPDPQGHMRVLFPVGDSVVGTTGAAH